MCGSIFSTSKLKRNYLKHSRGKNSINRQLSMVRRKRLQQKDYHFANLFCSIPCISLLACVSYAYLSAFHFFIHLLQRNNCEMVMVVVEGDLINQVHSSKQCQKQHHNIQRAELSNMKKLDHHFLYLFLQLYNLFTRENFTKSVHLM